MSIKEKAKKSRNGLQKGIYVIINPLVHLLIKCGVTPNMVTTIGLMGNVAAAVVLVWASMVSTERELFTRLIITGGLIIGFSLFDMLDGQVARIGGKVSKFGAMYDSVLDRYCELLVLGAVSFYFLMRGSYSGALITFIALIGSIMVSYIRARAEGLGVECKMGFMQRPERVVVTSLSIMATGIVGVSISPSSSFNPDIILLIAMLIIAVFANLTAFARLGYARSQMDKD